MGGIAFGTGAADGAEVVIVSDDDEIGNVVACSCSGPRV